MPEYVRIINNEEVSQLVQIGDCFAPLETAFYELGKGNAASVRRHDVLSEVTEFNAINSFKSMSGVVPALDAACLRVDSDLLRLPGRNGSVRREKLTQSQERSIRIGKENGLLMLYQLSTGELLAIFTDGEIQRLRVGVTSALAVKYLANHDWENVGFLGSGYQAETQLLALANLHPGCSFKVFSPNRGHLDEFASKMRMSTDCRIDAVENADQVAIGADILVSATNTLLPTVMPEWLQPGMHVNCIKKQEVGVDVLDKCTRVVVGSSGDTVHLVVGELRHRSLNETAKGWWKDSDHLWENYPFLADVIAGTTEGRQSSSDITCYLGHGTAVQFAAIAMLAYQLAESADVGYLVPSDRFLQPILQR